MSSGSQDTLAPQEFWDQGYENYQMTGAEPQDPVRRWIESHIPTGEGPALELGCFPGRYLAVFGDLGYELHGVDLTPRMESDLLPWLKQRGYKLGRLARGDIFTIDYPLRYQIVASFGLIEHFPAWADLLRKHASLVRPGGWLVVSTPNFRGFPQRCLHRWLNKEYLDLHNLDAMQPNLWRKIVREQGFEIRSCGYFGRFDFWVEQKRRSFLPQKTLDVIRHAKPILRSILPDSSLWSPYCGIVARRISA